MEGLILVLRSPETKRRERWKGLEWKSTEKEWIKVFQSRPPDKEISTETSASETLEEESPLEVTEPGPTAGPKELCLQLQLPSVLYLRSLL